MDYQKILANTELNLLLIMAIPGTMLGAVLLAAILIQGLGVIRGQTNHRGKIIFCGMCAGVVVLALLISSGLAKAEKISTDNRAALISNIQQKYDVDEVKLEVYETQTRPETVENQKIHVIVDEELYMFYLSQDKNTWEPTLSDPPTNGGNPSASPLKAENLLK